MTQQASDSRFSSVDAVLSKWRQGDCVVGEHWFVHRFEPTNPLTPASESVAEADLDLAEDEVLGMVIVSQTCDVVRGSSERPYVEVSPLVAVDEHKLRSIKRGRRPRYAYIPGLSQASLVADLDRVMTVEKAVVATWTRTAGCTSDEERRALADALARKRIRFAFPDDFTELTSELQKRLREKHDKKSEEGEALRALREIRVRAAPSWDSNPVHIMFWFIRNEDSLGFAGTSWDELLRKWLRLVPESGRFAPVDGAVVPLEDMTAQDYVDSDPLDLDHLSARSP